MHGVEPGAGAGCAALLALQLTKQWQLSVSYKEHHHMPRSHVQL
jgi:hypothetical protein